MKISQSIVLAAFLGNMSATEVAQAVEFIPDIHPEGVTLFKDFGLSTNGYPYQSFAATGAHQEPEMGAKAAIDTDIKTSKIAKANASVEVKKPKTEEEESKDQEVFDANTAVAAKAAKDAKADAPVEQVAAKADPSAPDALKDFKVKQDLIEAKNKLENQTEKTEDEKDAEFAEKVKKLSNGASRANRVEKNEKLKTDIEQETEDMDTRTKLIAKQKEVESKIQEDVKAEKEEEVVEEEKKAAVEAEKTKLKAAVAALEVEAKTKDLVGESIGAKLKEMNKPLVTPMMESKVLEEKKTAAIVKANIAQAEEKQAEADAIEEQKEAAEDARLAKTAAAQAAANDDLNKAQKKYEEGQGAESASASTEKKATEVVKATKAKVEKRKEESLTSEQWTRAMPEDIIQNGGYTAVQMRMRNLESASSESSSESESE